MKPTTALLVASLVANIALVAALVATTRPTTPQPIPRSHPPSAVGPHQPGPAGADALRLALESGDANAMQAAGLSPEMARSLAFGRAFSRIAEKIRAARTAQAADPRWWRQRDSGAGVREQTAQLRRELGDAMFAAFGEDFTSISGGTAAMDFLAPEKREALRRILQDYDEMMAKFGTGGIQLASDREKLRLLRAERDRDVAALLTPDERLAYELRTSPSAATVRARYGDGLTTEDDFRAVYALQKAFDEKYPIDAAAGRVSPEVMRQRMEAQRQLQDDIRAALGDEKFAALRRASDADLRNVESLVSRLSLPPGTTDQVLAARDNFAAESQRISSDASLNPHQRRTQIQDLGTKAKAELTRSLGAEAADAYAQRSPWVAMLQGGMGFSTTPPVNSAASMLSAAGQSVYPILPSAGGQPGTARQVIVTGGQTIDGAAMHGDVFFSPAGSPTGREGVQVMTFSTSTTETPAPVGAGEKRVIVTPPPADPKP